MKKLFIVLALILTGCGSPTNPASNYQFRVVSVGVICIGYQVGSDSAVSVGNCNTGSSPILGTWTHDFQANPGTTYSLNACTDSWGGLSATISVMKNGMLVDTVSQTVSGSGYTFSPVCPSLTGVLP